MKLEDLKNEYTGMPDEMRAMVEREVNKQVHQGHPHREVKRMSKKKAITLALVATMAIGTTVFAGSRLYSVNLEKDGEYGVTANLVVDESAESEVFKAPEQVPVCDVKVNYVPEGLVDTEAGMKYSNPETPYQGGISLDRITMDRELTEENILETEQNVVDSETLTINGNDAFYIELHTFEDNDISFNKRVYIAFTDQWELLTIFGGEDVSKEELLKVAEGIELVPTGEMEAIADAYTLSDWMSSCEETYEDDTYFTTTTKDVLANIHQIGDEFKFVFDSSLDPDEIDKNLSVKATKVEVADDLSLLDTQYINDDLAAQVGSDGKLLKNQIQYIHSGDGKNTLDEVVRTEEVAQKLVYVTLEYTNTSDQTMENICLLPAFMGIVKNADGYEIWSDAAAYDQDDTTDYSNISQMGSYGEMNYYDFHDGEYGKNYIGSIAPGETATVHVAKIVNEDQLANLYLNVFPSGGIYEFDNSSIATGYIDIHQ